MIKMYKIIIYSFSITSLLLTLFINRSLITFLPLLPLVYLLSIIIFKNFIEKSLKYKSIFIINLILLIRYLFVPILFTFDSTTLFNNLPNYNVINKAVLLMTYELIITMITLELLTRKNIKKDQNISTDSNLIGFAYLFCIFLLIALNPKLIERYSFILTTDTLKSKYIEGIDNSVQLLFVQLGHLILIASIIHISYKFFSKKSETLGLLFALILTAFFSMFIVGTSRSSVILPLTTSLLLLGDIYYKYKKKLYLISGFFIVFIILLTSKLKADTINSNVSSSFIESIHYQLQVYFSGFMNIAYALDSRNLYTSFQFSSILADIFRSVAYFGSLLHAKVSAFDVFNIRIYNGGLERDQILPMIGQGYLYFGPIFSPLFIVLTLYIVIKLENIYTKSSSIIIKFSLLICIVKFSLYQMSNFTIILSFATNIVIPMIFIGIFNKFIGRKRKF